MTYYCEKACITTFSIHPIHQRLQSGANGDVMSLVFWQQRNLIITASKPWTDGHKTSLQKLVKHIDKYLPIFWNSNWDVFSQPRYVQINVNFGALPQKCDWSSVWTRRLNTGVQTCRDDCRCIPAAPSLLPQASHSHSAAELALVPVLCMTDAACECHSSPSFCCVTDDPVCHSTACRRHKPNRLTGWAKLNRATFHICL